MPRRYEKFPMNVGFGKKIWAIFQWVGPAKFTGDREWAGTTLPDYKTEKGAERKIQKLLRGEW